MIEVTQLNGRTLVVNSDLIETIEAAPDTIITMTTKRKLLVKDPIPDVVAAVVDYRRRISRPDPDSPSPSTG